MLEICEKLALACDCSKEFLNQLHRRLRSAITCLAIGIAAFIALFLIIAVGHKPIFERLFGP